MAPLDLACDGHVHTAFSAGRGSVSEMVAAAERAGLTALTVADEAGPDSAWLPEYLRAVRRAKGRMELELSVGVQVEAVREDGWLAFPPDLSGLDLIAVSVGRLPLRDGPAGLNALRARLREGALRPEDVVELLVQTTARAVERAGRYAPTRLARPLGMLAPLGIEEPAADGAAVRMLATTCQVTGATVEVSERWRTPTPALVGAFADAGVRLVAVSDAHQAAEVGRWTYLNSLVG
jgi:histidinol phosphatase-like PHP family hydrolase